MARFIKLKSVLNKKNGQMNFSFPRKKMPVALRKKLKNNPEGNIILKFRYEGFE